MCGPPFQFNYAESNHLLRKCENMKTKSRAHENRARLQHFNFMILFEIGMSLIFPRLNPEMPVLIKAPERFLVNKNLIQR